MFANLISRPERSFPVDNRRGRTAPLQAQVTVTLEARQAFNDAAATFGKLRPLGFTSAPVAVYEATPATIDQLISELRILRAAL
jgi:hypothetical protein